MATVGLLHLQIDVDPRDREIQVLIDAPTNNGQLLHPMETISDIWPGQPPR